MTKHESQGSSDQGVLKPIVRFNDPLIVNTNSGYYPFVGRNLPLVCRCHGQLGFTLIELMITLVVLAVLLGIGVPNLRSFIQNSRITTQSNDVIGALAVARSEAIKRNKPVVLCRSADPAAAAPACASGGTGTWETGWLVFQDAVDPTTKIGNNTFATAEGDILLHIHETLPDGLTLRANNAALADYLAFAASGMTTLPTPAAGDPPHHFKLCDSRGAAYGRAAVLETTGRARISRQSTFASLSCP